MAITDIDTVVVDLAIVAGIYIIAASRTAIPILPGVIVFVMVLSGVSAAATGYVVTNFGTLFRLRLMATVPMCLFPAVVVVKSSWGAITKPEPKHRTIGNDDLEIVP